MSLDLLEYDKDHSKRLIDLSRPQRVALACWSAERLLPLYKRFVEGDDWMVIEPILYACWMFVRKGKAKLPAKLWKRVGELTSHYYYEGVPLVLYGVSSGTNLLKSVDLTEEEASAVAAARVLKAVTRAADEVDTVLGSVPRAADEARAWMESAFERLAAGAPLEPSGVDLETGAGLPEWWSDLVAHPNPVRRVKLD